MEEEIKAIHAAVGPDDHAICALSGGVDSTVAATLVHRALGDRLHCCFVDNGLLRSVGMSGSASLEVLIHGGGVSSNQLERILVVLKSTLAR